MIQTAVSKSLRRYAASTKGHRLPSKRFRASFAGQFQKSLV
jgi:hypothetical protein